MFKKIIAKLFCEKKSTNGVALVDFALPLNNNTGSEKLLNAILKGLNLNNISLPWALSDPSRALIPFILGAENYVAPLDLKNNLLEMDYYGLWGSTDNDYTNKIVNLAVKKKKPIVRLEYGFISSYDIALNGALQYSLVLSDNRIYYDARSNLQKDLLESSFEIDDKEIKRATKALNLIHKYGITKYTINLRRETKAEIEPRGILLVDQRYGDNSLKYANADQSNFENMLSYALKQRKKIYVKLHPDALIGNKQSCLKDLIRSKSNVEIITDTRNPYDLFDQVDEVYVVCSQVGLEAALYGKQVHCFGKAFYAGYGFTIDHVDCRKKRERTALELFYVYYILFSRYYLPGIGKASLENVIEYIYFLKRNNIQPAKKSISVNASKQQISGATSLIKEEKDNLRILFVLAGGRWGATGRYVQELAWYLQKEGAKVLILCEGGTGSSYAGVEWRQIKFEGIGLGKSLLDEVKNFNPNIIYENGVRTVPQRAALQLILMFNDAKLVVQNEDDDIQVFETKYPRGSVDHLTMLDKSTIAAEDLEQFLKNYDWGTFARMIQDPYYDRWIDPLLRIIFYKKADLFTAIWYPLGQELEKKFSKSFIVVPPVLPYDKYSKMGANATVRQKLIEKRNLASNSLIVFLPGTIYQYSNEFSLFVDVLNAIKLKREVNIFLMSKNNANVIEQLHKIDNKKIKIIDLGKPEDKEYLEILEACDIVCCPGFNDRFNRLRLPSRLVKPMMMGKPVITYHAGFGEYLEHEVNAILLKEDTLEEWSAVIERAFNSDSLETIGKNGQKFACANLDAKKVAQKVFKSFLALSRN